MILLTYDISNNKTRTKLSRFLDKYGRRLQYSVYEIHNSDRILDIVTAYSKIVSEKYYVR